MNEQLRQIESEVNAELDALAFRLDVAADPDILRNARTAARLAGQEVWLSAQPDPEPAPELIARIKAEIRGELVGRSRAPAGIAAQRRPVAAWWRLTIGFAAAAAVALAGLFAWRSLDRNSAQPGGGTVENPAPTGPVITLVNLDTALPDTVDGVGTFEDLGLRTAADRLDAWQASTGENSEDLNDIMDEIDTWLANRKAPSGSSDAGTGRKGQLG